MSSWSQYFPPPPEWSVDDVPDQARKVFFITGGTSGLGLTTAKVLLARNARVYITARNMERGRRAVNELRRISEEIRLTHLDLADLHSVKRAASEFLSKEKRLHVLINNAGVMVPPLALLTRQNYDLQFGVHVLGHFFLIQLLLPILLATARATSVKSRVLSYTAAGALSAGARVDYTSLMDGPARRRCGPGVLYRQSKLGTLLVALELAEQYGEQGIVSIALNPGNVHTDLTRNMSNAAASFWSAMSYSVTRGVITPLFAATAPKADHLNGQLLIPWARIGKIPPSVSQGCAQENLWDWLEAQTDCFSRVTTRNWKPRRCVHSWMYDGAKLNRIDV